METGYNSTFGATSPHGPRLLLYQEWWADCCLPRPPAAGPHGSARLVLFSPTLICGRVLAPRLHATRCLAPSVFAGEAGGPAPGQSSALDPCLPASGPALWGFCLAQPRKTHSLPASFLSRLSGHSICPLGPSLAVLSRLWETKKWLHASEHLRPSFKNGLWDSRGRKGRGYTGKDLQMDTSDPPRRTCPVAPGSGPGSRLSGWTSRGCVRLSLQ